VERSFLLEPGLPGRAWFRHAFYAPGVYTGYAAVVMPGVREALERNDAQGAAEQLEEVRAAIERGTQALNQALAAVEEAPTARAPRRNRARNPVGRQRTTPDIQPMIPGTS
jgi:N-acetylated-alpha-linked acidic dipeptidase